jgi:hypothetical protein
MVPFRDFRSACSFYWSWDHRNRSTFREACPTPHFFKSSITFWFMVSQKVFHLLWPMSMQYRGYNTNHTHETQITPQRRSLLWSRRFCELRSVLERAGSVFSPLSDTICPIMAWYFFLVASIFLRSQDAESLCRYTCLLQLRIIESIRSTYIFRTLPYVRDDHGFGHIRMKSVAQGEVFQVSLREPDVQMA